MESCCCIGRRGASEICMVAGSSATPRSTVLPISAAAPPEADHSALADLESLVGQITEVVSQLEKRSGVQWRREAGYRDAVSSLFETQDRLSRQLEVLLRRVATLNTERTGARAADAPSLETESPVPLTTCNSACRWRRPKRLLFGLAVAERDGRVLRNLLPGLRDVSDRFRDDQPDRLRRRHSETSIESIEMLGVFRVVEGRRVGIGRGYRTAYRCCPSLTPSVIHNAWATP